jgi:predicted dehydrogenase
VASPIPPPLRIAVIGAGHHSRTFHLPALAHFVRLHPGAAKLTGFVDPDLSAARVAATSFGFESAHATPEEMMSRAKPDACFVITPVAVNARVALQMAREGLPILMEKPLGATIAEARQLVKDLTAIDARAMVSMNRRFDPFLRAALAWIGPKPILHLKATMTRPARTEPEFVEHTGLHVVDAVCSIGGEVTSRITRRKPSGGGDSYQADLAFAGGMTASINLQPIAGVQSESIELSGDGFRVEVRSAEFDRGGWRAWSGDRLDKEELLSPGAPLFVANGTYAETEAFIHTARTGGKFSPAPADVLPAMEICHLMATTQPTPPVSP